MSELGSEAPVQSLLRAYQSGMVLRIQTKALLVLFGLFAEIKRDRMTERTSARLFVASTPCSTRNTHSDAISHGIELLLLLDDMALQHQHMVPDLTWGLLLYVL